MDIVNIIFIGERNVVRSVVSRQQFDKIYKPKGWVIENVENQEDPNIPELKTATKIKNYTKMRKVKERHFDDGLFKKEE